MHSHIPHTKWNDVTIFCYPTLYLVKFTYKLQILWHMSIFPWETWWFWVIVKFFVRTLAVSQTDIVNSRTVKVMERPFSKSKAKTTKIQESYAVMEWMDFEWNFEFSGIKCWILMKTVHSSRSVRENWCKSW